MEVFFNQCENQGCPNYAYRERDLNGEKVMLCYLHNYQSDQGEEGVALEFHQQQIFLAHIKNTSRNLKIYKSLMIQMLENLNSLIKNKTRAILKDISEKQLNVKILQKQVLNNQIFFSGVRVLGC
jgi:Na+/phosphate symporter